jgi:hypothetical protein
VVMGRDSGVEPLSVRPQTVMETEVVGVELVKADGRASRRVPKKTRIRIGGARREWQLRRLYLTPISASTSRKNFDVDMASAAYFGQVLTRVLPRCEQKLLSTGLFVSHITQRIG